jgi:transcriptional regulator with XRE-family HTH domain
MSEQKGPDMSWQQFRASHYFDWRRQQLTTHIRTLRERQGLSQRAIADWLGCSRSRIARIETGKGGFSLEELEVLALRLGEDPGRLIQLSPDSETLLQIAFTNEWSHRALGEVIECRLPSGLVVPQYPNIALSPDGALIAASLQLQAGNEADRPEVIILWNARIGTSQQRLPLDGWASAMTFSPNGRLLAVGTNMDTVKILDCATGQFLTYLDPVEDGYSETLWAYVNEVGYGLISQVCFSPDGRYLAVVNEDHGTLRIWETGSWQAVTTWALNPLYDDEEGDEESPFGEFAVSQIAFTPDSRHLVVIPFLGRANTAALFTVPEGKRVQRLVFPERVVSVGMASASDSPAGTIFAFGGHNHFWEVAYGEWSQSGRSWLTLYTAPAQVNDGFIRQTIQQAIVLSENCILALIEKQGHHLRSEAHTGTLDTTSLPCWVVVNLVSHQAAVLLDLGQEGMVNVTLRLADNGTALAFADSARQQIGVRSLQPEHLQTEALDTSTLLGTGLPAGIRQHLRPAESQVAVWYEEISDEAGSTAVPSNLPGGEIDEMQAALGLVQEDLDRMLHRLKTDRPAAEGGYGLARLSPGDQTTARHVVARIQTETDEKPLLIELPQRGPEIGRRALIGYIIGRPLRRGEFTDEWARRLVGERPYTLIFIDNAERLHPEALLWLCTNLRTVTDAFVLVVHNWAKFVEVAGRNHDAAWVLGRSIPVNLIGLVG